MHHLDTHLSSPFEVKSRGRQDNNSLEDEIEEMAYFLWESAGHPIGGEGERLLEARRQVALIHARDESLENIR